MDLPCGITGIQDRKDPLAVRPTSDLLVFRTHCYQAARTVGAIVEGVKDPTEAALICNYAIARFQFSDSVVAVLFNAVYPILAFCKYPVEGQIVFEYIDCPSLAKVFQALGGYKVAASEELNRPLVRALCQALTPSELKRVRYFRPARVGDVIFNYWD